MSLAARAAEPVAASRRPSAVELRQVAVTYGQGARATRALEPTDLKVAKGDFVALVGPSGCGKSTILKLVSELMAPSAGHILFAGRELGAEPVRVGMAFQSSTLLPWKSIRDNIMLPLKIVQPFRAEYRAKRKGEFRDRVDALMRTVGLIDFADKHPYQLSGGMQQRANLCRALVHEPDLLLLDEPFGALDQFTREELWGTLQALWMEKGSTVLLVTHDLREAAFLADRVVVMSPRPGRILREKAIDFARPRPLDLTFEAGFSQIVQELRALIVHDRTEVGR